MYPKKIHFGEPAVEAALRRLVDPPRATAAEVARYLGVTPRGLQFALLRRGWRFDHTRRQWVPPAPASETSNEA